MTGGEPFLQLRSIWQLSLPMSHWIGGQMAIQHPMICRFMKGKRRSLCFPVSRSLVPPRDLHVVPEGLKGLPFELLQLTDLKFMSLKTVLLLVLALAKSISDINALSVHSSCAQFFSGDVSMILKPNPWVHVLPLTLQLSLLH